MFHLTALVTCLSILMYFLFSFQVGKARTAYGVKAPATTGDPDFERIVRVHMNTLEWMPIFLPALWLFAIYISDALAAHLRELGGVIETGRMVDLLDGLPDADATLLDLTAWQAARLGRGRIPARLEKTLASFPHGPSVFKIDYALERPIPWKAEACHEAATIHVGGTFEEIASAERDVSRGVAPARPFVLLAQPTICDPSRAPAGGYIAWAYCHVPRGSVVDMTGAIEAQIERFAPGFGQGVLARHVSRPADLEAGNANLDGGDITGGACDLWHLLARPVPSPNPYRLGRSNLYLCSSSTPPGGGVHGMCGYHAARQVLATAGMG